MKSFFKFILILCLINITLNIFSQSKETIGINIGITQTLDDSKFYHGPNNQYSYLFPLYGINMNIFYDLKLFKYFSLELTSGYDQKGYFPEYITDIQGNLLSINAKTFNVISIGLALKPFINLKKFVPFILIGIRGDIILDKTNYPIDDYAKMLTGISLGLGLEYNFNKFGLFIIQGEFKPDLTVHNRDRDYKYRTFELKTGLGFKI